MGAILGLRLEFDCQDEMSGSKKDRLAALVIDRHCAFERALAASEPQALSDA